MTHVQDRMINVSEILALRTIKVNKGKFTLEIGPLNGQAHALSGCPPKSGPASLGSPVNLPFIFCG